MKKLKVLVLEINDSKVVGNIHYIDWSDSEYT